MQVKKHVKQEQNFAFIIKQSAASIKASLDKKCTVARIDLFSLCILFSHFRPHDATLGNSFFQTSEMGKQNAQAKKGHSYSGQ